MAMPNEQAAKECLDISLKRLGTDYVDYFLHHNVGGKRTAKFDEYGMWDWAQEQKAAGKIRYVGFSIHDDADWSGQAPHGAPRDGLRATPGELPRLERSSQ